MFGLWCAIFLAEARERIAQTILAARFRQKDSRSENVSYTGNTKTNGCRPEGRRYIVKTDELRTGVPPPHTFCMNIKTKELGRIIVA
jgi:hypothetical protein